MPRATVAFVALLGLVMAGQAGAADTKANNATERDVTFEGTVVAVDVPAHEFTVKSSEKGSTDEVTFHVARPTSIRIDGHTALLSELKGEHVTVTYAASGGTLLAKHLHRHKSTR